MAGCCTISGSIGWENCGRHLLAMVEEVVRQVVADVSENASAENARGCEPVVEEDRVSELPERRCQYDKESRWHYQTIPIHRQVVMNTVQKEVQSNSNAVVRQVSRLAVRGYTLTVTPYLRLTHQGGTDSGVGRIQRLSIFQHQESSMQRERNRFGGLDLQARFRT